MLRLTSMTSTQRDQLHDQLFRHERVEFDQRLAEVRGDQGARQDPEVELDDYGGVADDNSSNSGEHGEFTRNVCQILRNMGETELQETSRGLKLLSYCYRKVHHNGPEFGIGKLLMDFLDLFAQAVTRYHLSGRKGTGLEVPRTDTNLHGSEARRSPPAITINTLGMGARNGDNPVETDEAKTKCHDGSADDDNLQNGDNDSNKDLNSGYAESEFFHPVETDEAKTKCHDDSADNDKGDLEEEDVKPVQVTKRTPEVDEDSDSGYVESELSDARLPPDSQEGQETPQVSPRSREEDLCHLDTARFPNPNPRLRDGDASLKDDEGVRLDNQLRTVHEPEKVKLALPTTNPFDQYDGDYKSPLVFPPLESLLAEEGARRVTELGEALLALRLRKLNDLSRDFRMKKQAMATYMATGVNILVSAA